MLKLEARPQPSAAWTYGSPVLALLVTVLIGVLLFVALGKDPVAGLRVFFWDPIKSPYALGELTVKATPLLLIALGLAVCFRSNVWNIGAEGQYVLGAIAASGVALLADKGSSSWIVLPVVLAGVLGGMFWAGITAWLRDRFNANEILVSLMLVYVAVMLLSFMVSGPWKDPQGYNFPQSRTSRSAAWRRLPPVTLVFRRAERCGSRCWSRVVWRAWLARSRWPAPLASSHPMCRSATVLLPSSSPM